jgi:DNA-binding NarL/FixJ family response regulator
MSTARILIVDDHPVVRLGLQQMITQEPDMEVCAMAESATEALATLERESFDLIIVDLSLPDRNGLELIKQIESRDSAPKILVNSMHSEKLFAQRALKAGAKGYVSKEESTDELLTAIRKILEGGIYLSEAMTQHLLQVTAGTDPAHEKAGIDALSDRELEVFGLLGKALTTREIAKRLNLSVKTVETHRENIKAKLGLKNHNELIRRAVEWWLDET